MPTDCIDEKCDAVVMYKLTSSEQDLFREAYNAVYPDSPIVDLIKEIRRVNAFCTACDYRLKFREENYCIKVTPEDNLKTKR